MTELIKGTQIIYVPDHAKGNIEHPDCEMGFVTNADTHNGFVFCRYWSKHFLGELRTAANSELTPIANIMIHDSFPQQRIDDAIAYYNI